MDELNLTFARKNGRFTLCVTIKGTTTRHYKTFEGLLDKPNYKLWDSKNQRFEGSSISTVRNNQILREIREKYEQLIARLHPSDGKELFRMEREMENRTLVHIIHSSSYSHALFYPLHLRVVFEKVT